MQFSPRSEKYINIIDNLKACHISHKRLSHTLKNNVILKLYRDVLKFYLFILKQRTAGKISANLTKINVVHQIYKPSLFNSHYVPKEIKQYINSNAEYNLIYTYKSGKRRFRFHFVLFDQYEIHNLEKYDNYVNLMLVWLYIAMKYSSKVCSVNLDVCLYLTDFEKNFPNNLLDVLGPMHVNTAVTTSCMKNTEIMIFRQSEWFKVFIHETFHSFGLDFSTIDLHDLNNKIKETFPISSQINLFEAYCETWACIINVIFCSFNLLENKTDVQTFYKYFETCIYYEHIGSLIQCQKVLDFMGLEYNNLYTKDEESRLLRLHFYKENTNVFSYYIVKTILINNYPAFMNWCYTNNISLLQFQKTPKNLNRFWDFILDNYKSKSLLDNFICVKNIIKKLSKKSQHTSSKSIHNFLSTSQMSICELV
jgi:hypothetical protein